MYVEGYVFNTFNTHQIVNLTSGANTVINTTILTSRNSACGTKFGQAVSPSNPRLVTCQAFNPFTDTPVEFIPGVSPTTGVYNFERAYNNNNTVLVPNGATLFGVPTSKAAYQNPRSFSMALGVRF